MWLALIILGCSAIWAAERMFNAYLGRGDGADACECEFDSDADVTPKRVHGSRFAGMRHSPWRRRARRLS